MATMSDPRAAAFKAASFRDAIRFAMTMGLPDAVDQRVTFQWSTKKTFSVPDPAGNPYSWSDTPTKVVTHDDVQVPVAVQFKARATGSADGTPFGAVENPQLILTLLDEDYAQVEGADLVVADGSTYIVDFIKPPDGLFDVTIYTIYCKAQDES